MLFVNLYLFLLMTSLLSIAYCNQIELNYLTNKFFQNLEINLKDDNINETIPFIDKQVANYLELMKARRGINDINREKRNLQLGTGSFDFQKFEGLKAFNKIPVTNAKEITLFKQGPQWYAIALDLQQKLVIFKHNGSDFEILINQTVNNGTSLASFTNEQQETFIMVTKNSKKSKLEDHTPVFKFQNNKLKKVQNLDLSYASDATFWSQNGELFLAVCKELQETEEEKTYKSHCVIYKWLGGHFDILQQINTSRAIQIKAFSIGKLHFLAVANKEDDSSNTKVNSEIFKYDLNDEKYHSFQKISTNGITTLEFFAYEGFKEKEYFLVISSLADKKFPMSSIIYKFIDGYFIPFQSFELPQIRKWTSVIGPNKGFVLIASNPTQGAVFFQYNGWKFIESPIQLTKESLGTGLRSIKAYNFEGKPIIVVSNEKNIEGENIFEIDFKEVNTVDKYYTESLQWCRNKRNELEQIKNETNNRNKRQAEEIVTTLHSVESDNASGHSENMANNLTFLCVQLESQRNQIGRIQNKLNEHNDKSRNEQILPDNFVVRNLIVKEKIIFKKDLTAESINEINVLEFFEGIRNIDQKIVHNELQIQNAIVENNISPQMINGQPLEKLLIGKNLTIDELKITGNLSVPSMDIQGTLNGKQFDESNILLKGIDQRFENLAVNNLMADNLNATRLNDHTMNSFNDSAQVNTIKITEDIDNLSANNIVIDGLINNLDLPTLDKHALKRFGNQEITAEYLFDKLEMDNLETTNLNGYSLPEDLVLIDKGEYIIHQEIDYLDDLHVPNLAITDSINHISVSSDGRLNLLLKNSSKVQNIEGFKQFEKVFLKNSLVLQTSVSPNFGQFNPLTKIDGELEILGDVTVHGNAIIENLLNCLDMCTTEENLSINKLTKSGLKLTDKKIGVKLDFKQQMNVHEIFVNKINGNDTGDWVINGHREPQYIRGMKIFEGDLHITGNTISHNVNTINLPSLENNILKTEGNQIITGKLSISKVVTGDVISKNIKLGSHPFSEILLNNAEQNISGNLFVTSLSVDHINIEDLILPEGALFNDINFSNMMQDTLFKSSEHAQVMGHKKFKNLHVDDLLARKSINMNRIPNLIARGEAMIPVTGHLDLPDGLIVENITFTNMINNAFNASTFATGNWLYSAKQQEQTLAGNQIIDRMVIYGNLEISSKKINDLDFDDVVINTVKADEEFRFEQVTFEKDLSSLKPINLMGHFEDLDLNNILADSGKPITMGELNFKAPVRIVNNLESSGLVNGLNFTTLCAYSNPYPEESPKTLVVNGSAVFLKEPIITTMNAYYMENLVNDYWYDNKAANLTTFIKGDYVNFRDGAKVAGMVNEISLDWLRSNYFSKSANQTVTASISFDDGIIFGNGLYAEKLNLRGTIDDIQIDEFLKTALLDGVDQIFEDPLVLDSVTIQDLQGVYKVNNLDLNEDVMRYDTENLIVGKKTIKNLKAETLISKNNIKVQNVDLNQWTKEAILTEGSYNINGQKTFKNFTLFNGGLSLSGLLNNKVFNKQEVLLKSETQDITGQKTFMAPVKMESVKLKGTINNMKMSELMQNMVQRHKENIIQSPVRFEADIFVENINFEGLYQGVEISALLHNLSEQAFLNNYINNYALLKDASEQVQTSLILQANFVDNYQTVQIMPPIVDIFPVMSQENFHLAALNINNSFLVDFLQWNDELYNFDVDPTIQKLEFHNYVTHWAALEYGTQADLYFEMENDAISSPEERKLGHILSKTNETYEIVDTIIHSGSRRALPLLLPASKKRCLLLLHASQNHIDIYCPEEKMQIQQRIPGDHIDQIEITTIDNYLYIICIDQGLHALDPKVLVYKYDPNTELFNREQKLYMLSPNSLSAISHNDIHYLAITSGHILNSKYFGQVTIKRFDKLSQQFVDWDVILINDPVQVELSALPSNELMLYILTNSPTPTLFVYEYQGLSKFQSKGSMILENCAEIVPITYNSYHFLLAKCLDEINIIKATFKGTF